MIIRFKRRRRGDTGAKATERISAISRISRISKRKAVGYYGEEKEKKIF